MTKQQYLDALQAALAGLPAEQVAKTLAYYEQRFVDAAADGRSEESVAAELEEPRKIAITLRTNSHLHNLRQPRRSPVRAVRTVFSAMGLAIFNLFMLVPGIVYASLVAALYLSAVAFYTGGVVVASSGLAGVNHLVINTPLRYVTHDDGEFASTQTHVSISSSGINVDSIPVEEDEDSPDKREVLRRAERAAIGPVEISTDLEPGARTTQTLTGIALMIGGILLTLLSVVVTRFTLVGIRKYFDMNLALLRGQ